MFDALGAADKESLEFFEEWALRLGQYGAADGFDELEIKLDEEKFKLSPQPIQLTEEPETDNLIYNIPESEVYLKPSNYNNTPFPTKFVPEGETQVRTAGYVRTEDIKYTVVDKSDILNIAYNGHFFYDTTMCKPGDNNLNQAIFTECINIINSLIIKLRLTVVNILGGTYYQNN